MALTSALFTGLSGLNANQTKLNVIGNNIANTNTTAFKSSRAQFASQFYLTDMGGSAPNAVDGGANPSQRGLGTQVASIEKDMTQGSLETTGKNTDLAVDGNGFFVVSGSQGQQYTRAGNFNLNAENKLTTNTGEYVMGYGVDDANNVVKGKLQQINIPNNLTSQARASTSATLEGNLDADGEVASGASVLGSKVLATISGDPISDATALTDLTLDDGSATPMFDGTLPDIITIQGTKGGRSLAPLTYTVDATSTVKNLQDFIAQGLQIKTDETSPTGFNQPGVELSADGRLIITGNPGADNAVSLTGTSFTSTNAAMKITFSEDATSKPVGESVYTSMQVYDSLGTPVNVDVTAYLEEKSDAGSTWRFIAASPDNTSAKAFDPTGLAPTDYYGAILGSGTMKFDNKGAFLESTPTSLTLDRTGTGATPQQVVALDVTQLTAMATARSNLTMSEQDGYASGTLTDFDFANDGTISGSFSNGQTRLLGQLAVAMFDNPAGMTDQGGNVYTVGPNSGEPTITSPQEMSSGTIRSGSLEQSNVDISKEFINMIVASTGFTAASRVITTSDQLLTELMNTSR
ncbi:MAG TPA: flagellar hook protein FlgE [Tepidisphaeraceae bacterium]|jgi:flagellar hook protein FlgE